MQVIKPKYVTTLIKSFFEEFNGPEVASKMLCDVDSLAVDPRAIEEITAEWEARGKEASDLGTIMHDDIHKFYTEGTRARSREFKLFLTFHKRVEQLGYVPFSSEKKLYDPEYKLAGVADMLYIHKNDLRTQPSSNARSVATKLWLIDWKRTKQIKFIGFDGRVGQYPLEKLQDCNYEHYTMQLNLYKRMLEKQCGYKIVMMSIVVLHPDNQAYEIHHCRDRQDLAYKMLEARKF
ncbi:Hypothetical protein POVR2_LOCUS129 [uncultured virus]|nr:Hypothetical protein POVR2_LOCUS129 [uncultured virus]